MIVNLKNEGWEIFSHSSHGLLAGKIANEIQDQYKSKNWVATLAAIIEHDDRQLDFNEKNYLTKIGTPKDFLLENRNVGEIVKRSKRLLHQAEEKSTWISMLIAHHLRFIYSEIAKELNKIKVPAIKIVVTGTGKVGAGVREILEILKIKEVSVNDYLKKEFNEPVYVQLDVLDYNVRTDGRQLDKNDFFVNPTEYRSTFMRFAKVSDIYIASHFYGEGAPFIITHRNTKSVNFNIKVIGDISCDIDGPIAPTIRHSTIANPVYGYNPDTKQEINFKDEKAIVVMAVDNLPCELPDNASRGFGSMFIKDVIPAFYNDDKDGVLQRAKMTENGKLTQNFKYLQEYVDGKE